jgi:hypothetical protein
VFVSEHSDSAYGQPLLANPADRISVAFRSLKIT